MDRREFMAAGAASLAFVKALAAQAKTPVRLGVDAYSFGAQNWTPFQTLDYCHGLGVKVVHFSEIRFVGNLETGHLKEVREYAAKLNMDLEIGTRSLCPSSSMFDPKQGTAEEQLLRMVAAAQTVGSPIVRCVLGSSAERSGKIPLEGHIENMAKLLRGARPQIVDAGVKIAIENHAGDMQARELKTLIEAAGKDYVGVCLDSGNPLWTIESPHLTLATLAPYVLTSHVRDSAVWATPRGAAVEWVRTGEGNVDIAGYIRKYVELCPGKALSAEIIVQGRPRMFNYKDASFWEPYRNTPAWEFQQFVALAERGQPRPDAPAIPPDQRAKVQQEDVEVSVRYTQSLFA